MGAARELRFVLATDDFDSAARLFRDVLGLELVVDFGEETGRGILLRVPEATLELVDLEHKAMVDGIEVGRTTEGRCRIALIVDDLEGAARDVSEAGAEAMAAPVETPWGDRNQRFRHATAWSSRCSSRRPDRRRTRVE
jgi:catechol 2,3-dioxygenase-like lactoylglutathione lyase family enzyme